MSKIVTSIKNSVSVVSIFQTPIVLLKKNSFPLTFDWELPQYYFFVFVFVLVINIVAVVDIVVVVFTVSIAVTYSCNTECLNMSYIINH